MDSRRGVAGSRGRGVYCDTNFNLNLCIQSSGCQTPRLRDGSLSMPRADGVLLCMPSSGCLTPRPRDPATSRRKSIHAPR